MSLVGVHPDVIFVIADKSGFYRKRYFPCVAIQCNSNQKSARLALALTLDRAAVRWH